MIYSVKFPIIIFKTSHKSGTVDNIFSSLPIKYVKRNDMDNKHLSIITITRKGCIRLCHKYML